MKKIDKKLIGRLEKLSRIKLSKKSAGKITKQLDSIVSYFQQLQDVDTTDVPPTNFWLGAEKGRLREDRSVDGLPQETALSQAPDAKDGYFRVPKVIDKGEG